MKAGLARIAAARESRPTGRFTRSGLGTFELLYDGVGNIDFSAKEDHALTEDHVKRLLLRQRIDRLFDLDLYLAHFFVAAKVDVFLKFRSYPA